MKLIFIWIQGSWKWTQSRILKEKFAFHVFETGWALREIAKENSELWVNVKKIIDSWNLVDIKTVWDVFKNFLNNNSIENIILDWIPRNKLQKEMVDGLISDFKVVLFDLPREEVEKRLLWRMYNPKTWETFLSWVKTDPKTWDILESRKDDNEESIKKRIELFFTETMPIIEQYENENKLIRINANQKITEVTDELIIKLNLK